MKQNACEKSGVILSKVDAECLNTYLSKLGLSTDGSEQVRVIRLHEAMQLVPNKAQKIGNCSTCRGKSHVDLVRCPFCGDGDADQTVLSQRSAADDPEAKITNELRELIAKQRAEEAAKAAKDKQTVPSPVAGQELVSVPKEARSKRASKAKGGAEQSGQLTIAGDDKPVPESKKGIASVADLDSASNQIKQHLNNAARSVYDAAVILSDVFERKLWMQRRKEDNTPKYDTFAAWVSAEMPFTVQYAYELTSLPKFYTREQAERIGSTKLTLSLRIEPEQRKALLESGKLESMSVREVKETITQHPNTQGKNPERAASTVGGKAALPGAKRGPKAKPAAETRQAAAALSERVSSGNSAPANDPPKPKIKPEPLTIVTCVLPNRIEFDMLRRAPREGDPPVRAKDLSDDPFAEIMCANGAKLRIVLFRDEKGLLCGALTAESTVRVVSRDDEEEDEDTEE